MQAISPSTDLTPESVVRRYFAGCNTGDVETLRSTLAADVVHYFLPGDRPPIHGDEHLARFWAKMKQALHVNWSVDHLLALGDEVVLEWSVYWTDPGGTRRVNRGTDWYVVRDGRITEVRAYLNWPSTGGAFLEDSQLVGFPYGERGYLVEG